MQLRRWGYKNVIVIVIVMIIIGSQLNNFIINSNKVRGVMI